MIGERVGSIEKGVGRCGKSVEFLAWVRMRGFEMVRDNDDDRGRGRYNRCYLFTYIFLLLWYLISHRVSVSENHIHR